MHRAGWVVCACCVIAAHTLRRRVEIMGSHTCRIVRESQSVLVMTNPIIFTRTRTHAVPRGGLETRCGVERQRLLVQSSKRSPMFTISAPGCGTTGTHVPLTSISRPPRHPPPFAASLSVRWTGPP
jgi:hypothetical protein